MLCGRKDGRTDRQIDMTKLIAAFRNFAKKPIKFGLNIFRASEDQFVWSSAITQCTFCLVYFAITQCTFCLVYFARTQCTFCLV